MTLPPPEQYPLDVIFINKKKWGKWIVMNTGNFVNSFFKVCVHIYIRTWLLIHNICYIFSERLSYIFSIIKCHNSHVLLLNSIVFIVMAFFILDCIFFYSLFVSSVSMRGRIILKDCRKIWSSLKSINLGNCLKNLDLLKKTYVLIQNVSFKEL